MTPKQRVARAVAEGPQPGTMTRTSVKLEQMSPRGAWTEDREVAPERIERLAQSMMAKGVEPAKARGVAILIAEDALRFVPAFEAWREESDAECAERIVEAGQLAFALREALADLGPRAEHFIHESMREDMFGRRFLPEHKTATEFFHALEMAARKVDPPAHRPINAPAQAFLRGAIRTWRNVVGEMPSPPNKREDADERPHALHNILRDMVADAAQEHVLAGHMLAQISVGAFGSAHAFVVAEFERDGS